jgi:hypothetical protein
MNFQVVFSISLFLSLCTCALDDYSMSDFLKLFKDQLEAHKPPTPYIEVGGSFHFFPNYNTGVKFERYSYYVLCIIKFFNKHPLDCLNKALAYDFKIGNMYFAYLFFKIISDQKEEYYSLCLDRSSFEIALYIRQNISFTIQNILFEPFDSLEELQNNILVVGKLIEFLKRYSIFSPEKNYEYESGLVSKQIADWENLMSYLLEKSPHGDIDYNFLVSFVRLSNGITDLVFPPEDDKFKTNCLIFASYLNQLIRRKDFNIFKFDHPNLVFLLAIILEITDERGRNNTGLEYQSLTYYHILKYFFEVGINPFRLLESIQKKKGIVLRKSIEMVGGETVGGPFWISNLTIRFEEYFNEQQSDENKNLLFRLKCFAIMERYQRRAINKSSG